MKIELKPWQLGMLIFSAGGVIILCSVACVLVFLVSGPLLLTAPTAEIAQGLTKPIEVSKAAEVTPPTATTIPTVIPTVTLFPTPTPVPTTIPTAIPLPPTPALPAIGACAGLNERVPARVVNVVDGDTIDVVIGEQNYAVRYIGMNTPERGDPSGPAATNFNSSLVKDQVVTLVKDVSETDSFGRLLRYVFVGDLFVNYELVRQGYATATSYPPDTACDLTYQTGQLEAQVSKVGMWAVMIQPTLPVRLAPTVPVSVPPTQPPVGGGTCNCSGPDLDCGDLGSHTNAQACFDYCRSQGFGDVFNLDRDNDGLACEG